jgi:hypothetical protein
LELSLFLEFLFIGISGGLLGNGKSSDSHHILFSIDV